MIAPGILPSPGQYPDYVDPYHLSKKGYQIIADPMVRTYLENWLQ